MSGAVFDYEAIRARLNGVKIDETEALKEYIGKYYDKARQLSYKYFAAQTLPFEDLPKEWVDYYMELIGWIKDNPIP